MSREGRGRELIAKKEEEHEVMDEGEEVMDMGEGRDVQGLRGRDVQGEVKEVIGDRQRVRERERERES